MSDEHRILWNLTGNMISILNRISFPMKKDTRKIVRFDPSKSTDNLGDYIIMRYCSRIKNKKTDTDDYLFTKNEIRKPQKNISPELLASFGRQLTKTEDIRVELHGAVLD